MRDFPVPEFADHEERQQCEHLSDLYAIVRTTDHLERAFMRDHLDYEAYLPRCERLLAQFATVRRLTADAVPDVAQFMRERGGVDCKAGIERLEKGSPYAGATGSKGGGDAQAIAVAATAFVTAMDSLKLNMIAVDEVHPLIADLVEDLQRISQIPSTFTGLVRMNQWMDQLHSMKADEELSPSDQRQLLFDLECAHTAFLQALSEAPR